MAQRRNKISLVIMGTTGTGKSTLANSLLGLPIDADSTTANRFTMSAGARGCTMRCSAKEGYLLGDRSKAIRIIDTPGHGDGHNDNFSLREEIIKGMKAEKEVHAFIWAKNSEAPRMDSNDKEFMEIFSEIFGPGFSKNMVVIFTR